MFILKLIGKICLVPLWILIAIVWLLVHVAVCIFGIFHGFWKIFFSAFIILALAFGMWQNVLIFAGAILATFLILFAGAFIDALLEIARQGVGRLIIE